MVSSENLLEKSYWRDVVDFLSNHILLDEPLLAPIAFQQKFIAVQPYSHSLKSAENYTWVVIHKGAIAKLDGTLLKAVVKTFIPVFANEVFVVFSRRLDLPALPAVNVHLSTLTKKLAAGDFQTSQLDHAQTPGLDSNSPKFWQKILSPLIQPLSKARSQINAIELTLGRMVRSIEAVQLTLGRVVRSIETIQLNAIELTLGRMARSIEVIQRYLETAQSKQLQPQPSLRSIAAMTPLAFKAACRADSQSAYLGNRILLCRVLSRYLLYAISDDIGIVPSLALNGCWEPNVSLAIARVVQPGWHCIDVGANHGYYSLLMAGLVEQQGRVLAVEPIPQLAELVAQTLEVNGFKNRATVVQTALSDRSGETANLFIPRSRRMNASVTRPPNPDGEVVQVALSTLDELTQVQDWPQIHLVKIDAEGAEEQIWFGMQAVLSKYPDVIVILEFNDARYRNPRGFLENIVAQGFVLAYIKSDSQIASLTIEACLHDRPGRDWMLYLQRTKT